MPFGNLPARKAADHRARATVATYTDDSLYGRIDVAVATILQTGKVVTPIDVLVAMNILAPDKLEDWYTGRVPYLSREGHHLSLI